MKRVKLLQNIRDAKESHLQWLNRARHLVSGLPIENEMIPLEPTACKFGVWLYTEGMKYKNYSKLSKQMDEIERTHSDLHKVYLEIYKIYFTQKKKSLLRKITLRNKKIVSYKEKKNATYFYYELEHISDKLSSQLDLLERSLKIVSDEIIEKCTVENKIY